MGTWRANPGKKGGGPGLGGTGFDLIRIVVIGAAIVLALALVLLVIASMLQGRRY